MAVPDPSQVAPWYLRNITQALELDEATGNVFIRTNASIIGNVSVGNVAIGALGNIDLTSNTMPVTIDSGNVTVWQGTDPWNIEGNVNANVSGNVGIIGNVNVTQGTTPWAITGNVQIANAATDVTIADSTYEMNVARGLVDGQYAVFKAGYNPSIANNTEESLWGHSNLYPWSSWGAGGTLSCVSANAGDTGQLRITGLRTSDWAEITESLTMTGTTPVVTSNSFIRINNVHYFSASVNAGAISISRGATVVGYIEAENGQGQMCQYTVPAGYTAYLLQGNSNMGKGNDGTGKFKYRLFGSNFQTAMTFLLYQSTFGYQFSVPLALPEKTDLDVTMYASVSGTACSCAYDMILIPN